MRALGFALIIILGFNNLIAQVEYGVRPMSTGDNSAFWIVIEKAPRSVLVDSWIKYTKKFNGKSKDDSRTKEVFSDNCIIPTISNNVIDLHAMFVDKNDKQTEVIVWFYLGGAFLSRDRHPNAFPEAVKFLTNFADEMDKSSYQRILDEEHKKLSTLKGEQKDWERKRDEAATEIKNLELKLEAAKNKKEIAIDNIKTKESAIEKQNGVTEDLKKKIEEVKKGRNGGQ